MSGIVFAVHAIEQRGVVLLTLLSELFIFLGYGFMTTSDTFAVKIPYPSAVLTLLRYRISVQHKR
jgi:hypothetical protein